MFLNDSHRPFYVIVHPKTKMCVFTLIQITLSLLQSVKKIILYYLNCEVCNFTDLNKTSQYSELIIASQ